MKGKLVKAIAAISAATMFFGMTTFAAPKSMSDGGTFDPEYYAQQNPDVVAALGTDENALYQHYLNNGRAEGRLPYAPGTVAQTSDASAIQKMPDGGLFDPVFYTTTYPDVAALIGTDATALYNHYKTNGIAMGRLPYATATPTAPRLIGTYTVAGGWKKQGGTYNFYLRNVLPVPVTVSPRGRKGTYGTYNINAASMIHSGDYPKLVTAYTAKRVGSTLPWCAVDGLIYNEAGALVDSENVYLMPEQTMETTTFTSFDGLPGNYYIEFTK